MKTRLFNKPNAMLLLGVVTILLSGLERPAFATGIELTFTGNRIIETPKLEKWVQFASGPRPLTPQLIERVVERLEKRYHERGFAYARVWCRKGDNGQTIEVAVDEGVLHRIAIIGVDAVDSILYRVDLTFPKSVFQQKLFDKALNELRDKYSLSGIYGEVRTNHQQQTRNAFGDAISQRELVVNILRTESFGWGLNVAFNPQWGLLPGVRTKHRSVFLENDRFSTQTRIAIPYREYIVQEEPTFQWVHGVLSGEYLFPFFGDVNIAPGLDMRTELSRYSREDLGARFLLTSRTDSYANISYIPSKYITWSLGIGVDIVGNIDLDGGFNLDSTAGVYPAPPVLRYAGRTALLFDFSPDVLREDHRSTLRITPKVSSTSDGKIFTDVVATSNLVVLFFDNEFRADTRLLYMHGDVRFWDERYLTGSYLRTHYPEAYWIREAGQLALSSRWGIRGDDVQLGLFHDFSVYNDRSDSTPNLAIANAFGPSFHYLFLQSFSLSVYYGMGFSSSGFGQTFSLNLKRVL